MIDAIHNETYVAATMIDTLDDGSFIVRAQNTGDEFVAYDYNLRRSR